MSLIPNTTCQRCHRSYPSFRSRCPHCGMKKPTVQRAVPEADAAVRGSEAARRQAENVNWQMLIGGILLVCIIVAVIAIVSVNVKSHIDETVPGSAAAAPDSAVAPTAIPTPTAAPTPSPTPPPGVTSLTITYGTGTIDDFTEPVGSSVDLDATPYPLGLDVTITWSSTDESVATVDQDGVVTIVGTGACEIIAEAGGWTATCIARGRN